jgi:carbonic anhydrase
MKCCWKQILVRNLHIYITLFLCTVIVYSWVIFQETNETNTQLQPILESVSHVTHVEGIPFKTLQFVRLQDLLPDEMNYYYRYAGSLTTPQCDESVVWTVLVHLMPIGAQQVISDF